MTCALNAKSGKKEAREEIIGYLLGIDVEIHHKDEEGHDLTYWCEKYELNVPSLPSKQ